MDLKRTSTAATDESIIQKKPRQEETVTNAVARAEHPPFLRARRLDLSASRRFRRVDEPADTANWYNSFNLLIDFKEECGHCKVPKDYCPNLALAKWVQDQRKEKKKWDKDKSSSTLTTQWIAYLDLIGFHWGNKSWEQHFAELKAFQAEQGHCNVPSKLTALYEWVRNQRDAYKRLQQNLPGQQLTAHRVEMLNSLSFDWDGSWAAQSARRRSRGSIRKRK